MSFSTIVLEKLGTVGRITLNRPERTNALNQVMLGEIGQALDEAERDPEIRAIVVRGAGSAFSSGFDLKDQMESRPLWCCPVAPDPAQRFRDGDALLALPQAD